MHSEVACNPVPPPLLLFVPLFVEGKYKASKGLGLKGVGFSGSGLEGVGFSGFRI